MRTLSVAFSLLAFCSLLIAQDETPKDPAPAKDAPADAAAVYREMLADAAQAKVLKAGLKHLKKFFAAAAKVDAGKSKEISHRDKAAAKFLDWMAETEKTLGVDIRGKPSLVIEMLDEARIAVLAKGKNGKIDYIKIADPRGLDRLEYSVLLPTRYQAKKRRYALVISLHERVINQKHPAFRGGKAPTERSRVTVHNGWLKSPASENTIIIAPTGNPNGFKFTKRSHYDDLHLLMRTLGEGLTHYRADWNRVFLEVHGEGLRVACEQALIFAGVILRDREDERALKIPAEQFCMFENLNGTPFLYIANEANWQKVGAPLSKALTAAYNKAGKPGNLTILKTKRDANGALKGDPAAIAAFVQKHRLKTPRKSFSWRYFNPGMASPVPIMVGPAVYQYDPTATLAEAAGVVRYDAKTIADGKSFLNVITIECTEAEDLRLLLWDGPIDLAFPVTVKVNGAVIHDKVKVHRDWNSFFSDILPRRFFMLPVVAYLDCEFKHKAQFVPKAKVNGKAVVPAKKDEKKDPAKKDSSSNTSK